MAERALLRRIFSLEALFAELVFVALTVGVPPFVRTLLDMSILMALMAGVGAGLLGVAAIFGLYVIPRHDRIREYVRVRLREFTQQGDAVIYVGGEKARLWKMMVSDFLSDAFGADAASSFARPDLPSDQLRELRALADQLPTLKIRPGFKPRMD